LTALFLLFFLSSCAEAPSTLAPKGPGAAEIAFLWWLMFGLATFVFILVMALLLFALFRRRDQVEEEESSRRRDKWLVIAGGIVMPMVILAIVYFFAFRALASLAAPSEALIIEVIGRQWWWEVHYPNEIITTANEIHIPVGEPVEFRVTSADVIHSFWVPELHGKIDMIPGRTNSFWIEASQPGVYYGECAEFCGIQHTKMAFYVIAEPADQFGAWVEQQRQPAPEPADEVAQLGQEVFFERAECSRCHAIKGTSATSNLGPDLTHLASRQTLAAGIIPNTRGHLGGWIINPQNIKPGNLMPSTNLTGEELQALLVYLETLE
jgi:cytochrome c oxidase subunit 2